jgi:hypothetical protein
MSHQGDDEDDDAQDAEDPNEREESNHDLPPTVRVGVEAHAPPVAIETGVDGGPMQHPLRDVVVQERAAVRGCEHISTSSQLSPSSSFRPD